MSNKRILSGQRPEGNLNKNLVTILKPTQEPEIAMLYLSSTQEPEIAMLYLLSTQEPEIAMLY